MDNYNNIVKDFMATDRMHRRVVEKYVGILGVHRSAHMLLMELNRHGMQSQSALAEKLRISTAAVAVKLKKLESEGFIVRNTDAEDSRVHNVTITEKGKEIVDKTMDIFSLIESEMLKGISENELEIFDGCLKKIMINLNALYTDKEENN